MQRLALLASIALLAAPAFAQDGPKIAWVQGPPDQALAKAAREHQPAIVYFSADWCKFCERLNATAFPNAAVVEALSTVTAIRVDCTLGSALAAARSRFGIRGVPTLYLYDEAGRKVDEIIGPAEAAVIARKVRALRDGLYRATGAALDPGASRGTDPTHRVFLRNGNTLDGRLEEFTTDILAIRVEPHVLLQLKTQDILRVELISIRSIGQSAVQVEPVTVGPPPKQPDEPVAPDRRDPVVEPVDPGEGPNVKREIRDAVEDIIKRAAGADTDRRQSLMTHLRSYGKDGARYLLWRIATLDADTTGWALQALATLDDLDLEKDVLALVSSPRANVRAGAANLLGAMRTKPATGALIRLLQDRDPSVKTAAALSLERIADPSSLPALASASIDAADQPRRQAIQSALQIAARANAATPLAEAWLSLASQARGAAAIDLATAFGNLAASTKASDFPRAEVEETLLAYLADSGAEIRGAAAQALARMSAKAAAQAVREALAEESDPKAITRFCEALGRFEDRESVEILIEQLQSSDDDVRGAAARALRTITKQANLGDNYDAWKKWHESFR